MTNIRKLEKTDKDKPLGGDFNNAKLAFLAFINDRWELKSNNIVKAHSIGYRKEDHARGKIELVEYGESLGYRVYVIQEESL